MRISIKMIAALMLFAMLSAFAPVSDEASDITGTWIRKTDHLRIKISERNSSLFESFIVAEGEEKFPCDVSKLPIYKNIVKVGRNLWTCDFLVVTMGSCATDYEEGIIQIVKNGDLEITCPGYEKKIYSKSNPRYDTDK
jgi:hypothetical protein